MGAQGSGNWFRWELKKTTVEESLPLAIGDFRGYLHRHSTGTLSWTSENGTAAAICFDVKCDGAGRTLTLIYRLGESDSIELPIRLQTTPTQFGGEQWWFTCPLMVDGVACDRRVRKLYLPPGAKYFGCRKCHDLTYRSCQEAHFAERTARQPSTCRSESPAGGPRGGVDSSPVTALFENPKEFFGDMRLVRRAVREHWPTRRTKVAAILEKVGCQALGRPYMNSDGVTEQLSESFTIEQLIGTVGLNLYIDGLIQKDEHRADREEMTERIRNVRESNRRSKLVRRAVETSDLVIGNRQSNDGLY